MSIRPKVDESYNFAVLFPAAAKEWHPTKNKDLKPTKIAPHSRQKFWWQCEKGHEFHQRAQSRGMFSSRCPICSQQEKSLAANHPELAKQWHPTKNKKTPYEVSRGSRYNAWWQCEKGHEWQATVNTRTNMNSGCGQCSNQSSRDEIRLLAELSWIFDSVKSRFKVSGKELDVFIEELSVGVEFDGSHWHKDKENADREKNDFMAQNGIKVIRFREEPLGMIGEEDIRIYRNKGVLKHHIDELLSKLCYSSDKVEQYLANDEFINVEMYLTYLEYFPSPFPEHSFALNSPDTAEEWHPNKNGPLTPNNFSEKSGFRAWWICEKGHEWDQTIHARVGQKVGCPYCSGRFATSDNNLVKTHPLVAKQWHPKKNNPVQPREIKYGSGRVFWWQCEKGHEWQAKPIHMTRPRKSPHCPKCRGK